MRWPTHRCGTILDLNLEITWDRNSLAAEVNRRHGRLLEREIRHGDVVAIMRHAGVYLVADLLAVWASGAVAAVLDPTLTPPERQALADFLQPSIVLVDEGGNRELLPGVAHHCIDSGGGAVSEPGLGEPADLALILVTSGTTGSPKAVTFSHQALQNRISCNATAIGLEALARALVTLPASFGHGLIGNILTPLLAGGDIVFPRRGPMLAAELGHLIDHRGITFLTSVPALWRMALRASPKPLGRTLRRVHIGSAPLSAQLWRGVAEWSGAATVNCYGLTEAANWFCGASSQEVVPRDGLVGRPWGGEARVLDGEGRINHHGCGELLIRSPSMMSGYFRRPDLTEACMIEGWYRTGDNADIEPDGQIVLQGRLKDEINRAGSKIQPAELDMLIESHPAVEEACAFAVADPITGESVFAAVRLKTGATASTEMLSLWCRERIRHIAVPERWYFVEDLPRTPRGKTRRDEVRRMLLAGEN